MQQNAICTNICHPRNKTEVKQFHNNKDREGEPKKKKKQVAKNLKLLANKNKKQKEIKEELSRILKRIT